MEIQPSAKHAVIESIVDANSNPLSNNLDSPFARVISIGAGSEEYTTATAGDKVVVNGAGIKLKVEGKELMIISSSNIRAVIKD